MANPNRTVENYSTICGNLLSLWRKVIAKIKPTMSKKETITVFGTIKNLALKK
jgi:hypothetical protein